MLKSLKADLLSIFLSASFFLLNPVLTAYIQQQCCPEARIYLSLYGVAAAAARQGRTSGCIPSRALDVGAITLKALGSAPSTPWGLWQAHWCQADRQRVLGLLLHTRLLMGSQAGATAFTRCNKELC